MMSFDIAFPFRAGMALMRKATQLRKKRKPAAYPPHMK
jgi:hypothetical protein